VPQHNMQMAKKTSHTIFTSDLKYYIKSLFICSYKQWHKVQQENVGEVYTVKSWKDTRHFSNHYNKVFA